MKRTVYRIGIFLALLIVVSAVQTYQVFAESVVNQHVVLAVGPNNAIASSVLIGLGAVAVMVFDKFKEDESSED